MKKTNNKMQLLLLSVVLLGTTACTGDFADINRNPGKHGKIDPVGTDEIDPVKTA